MNIFKSMSAEEKRRYGKMSREEQEAFRMEKERQRESGRKVGTNVFDIPQREQEEQEPAYVREMEEIRNDISRGIYGAENRQKKEDKVFSWNPRPEEHAGNIRKEQGIRKEQEHDHIYMQFVIDATYSFSRVFPPVYHALQACMERISEKKKEFPNIKVRYGLVLFDDKIEPADLGGERFTESEKIFIERLRDIRFAGGSADGYEENINKAVEKGLRILENESEEHANRGILLFTDSLPRDLKPDFYSLDNCKNRGLRFAVCYLNNDEYVPMFRITDRDGDVTENGKNRCADIRGLESLFGSQGIETIQKQINDIMYKSSVLTGM